MCSAISESGNITNRRVVVEIPEDRGIPDGMAVDEEGMIWVAQWGGPELDELYITTSSIPAPDGNNYD